MKLVIAQVFEGHNGNKNVDGGDRISGRGGRPRPAASAAVARCACATGRLLAAVYDERLPPTSPVTILLHARVYGVRGGDGRRRRRS